MPDPISFQPQSSSDIVGMLNQSENVLYRGRVTLTTTNQGPSSIYAPYYYASNTKDLSFLNTAGLFPQVEVFMRTGTAGSLVFTKCPFLDVDPGTLNVGQFAQVQLSQRTSKVGGYTLGLTIGYFNKTQNTTREFYYTVLGVAVGSTDSSRFPNDGSFA